MISTAQIIDEPGEKLYLSSVPIHCLMPPKKNQHRHPSTISALLKHFIGYSVTVELKSETEDYRQITGVIFSADQYMNLVLQAATSTFHRHNNKLTNKRREEQVAAATNDFSLVHIKGTKIRYIHFPPHLNIQGVVAQGLREEAYAKKRYQRTKRQKR